MRDFLLGGPGGCFGQCVDDELVHAGAAPPGQLPKGVSELLAHSKMATTADIYSHADPSAVMTSANKMGALLAEAR